VTPDSGMTNVKPPVNSPSWVLQSNGLKTWDVVQGTGTPVAPGETITIFYTGWLTNGTVFDSKRSPDNPAQFSLTSLIQGWQQGIPTMKNGGIRRLYVPAALAYGGNGQGSVPPNSDLIFEIKLISHP
jgi:FKBP-type peptidyl-prolyl cis-trans isomerase